MDILNRYFSTPCRRTHIASERSGLISEDRSHNSNFTGGWLFNDKVDYITHNICPKRLKIALHSTVAIGGFEQRKTVTGKKLI